jgi:RNA polymerase sigma factor (sigma-70 family)
MQPDRDELIPTRWSLIQRLKNWNDDESWREFFDTYWRLIYGTAMKSGLNHQHAEEVVQETVITVCKKMPEFNADPAAGSFKGWLMLITRRRIGDQIRKVTRDKARRHVSAAQEAGGDERRTATEERVPDPAGNALERIWNEEWERNMIDAGLERLQRNVRPEHFQIFVMVAIKQRPFEAAAKLHGITVAQVSVIKHRLGQRFAKIVKALQDRFERDPATGRQG